VVAESLETDERIQVITVMSAACFRSALIGSVLILELYVLAQSEIVIFFPLRILGW
jgi:hypothetical protein